jgi:hypothetical protein
MMEKTMTEKKTDVESTEKKHSQEDTKAVFSRREDKDRVRGITGRKHNRRVMPQRGDQPKSVLQVEQGIS